MLHSSIRIVLPNPTGGAPAVVDRPSSKPDRRTMASTIKRVMGMPVGRARVR